MTIFYELKSSDNVKRNTFKNKKKISSGKYAPKLTKTDRRSIYDGLDSEIKIRQYSKLTLNTYSGIKNSS